MEEMEDSFLKKMGKFFLRFLPDYVAIHVLYFRKFKKICHLKNPRTYNEKINWRKLYQRDPRFPVFIDKIAVKAEIVKLIGEKYLIPTLWSGENPRDIPFDTLKPPYVIKANHGCGGHIFIRSAADIDREVIYKQLNFDLSIDNAIIHREWGYGKVKPMVLVEKMLLMPDDEVPTDYKIFVYDGHVHLAHINVDRFGSEHKLALFDRDWKKLPVTFARLPIVEGDVPKPLHYDLMVELAEKVGALFDFVRVDFYDIPEGVFFGEVTFYPAGGLGTVDPPEWDEFIGRPWNVRPYRS